jgi:hypothetical protein
VLLMDEPFGALDAHTRTRLQNDLLNIWERDRKTVLFVTHSVDEAVFLSDKVVVMTRSPGRIKQVVDIDLPRRAAAPSCCSIRATRNTSSNRAHDRRHQRRRVAAMIQAARSLASGAAAGLHRPACDLAGRGADPEYRQLSDRAGSASRFRRFSATRNRWSISAPSNPPHGDRAGRWRGLGDSLVRLLMGRIARGGVVLSTRC